MENHYRKGGKLAHHFKEDGAMSPLRQNYKKAPEALRIGRWRRDRVRAQKNSD